MSEWLLIETFGGDVPPSVIGAGSTPKAMVPVRKFFGRSPSLQPVEAAVARVLATGQRDEFVTRDRQRRVIAEPLTSYRGDVHGAWVWADRATHTPPPRDLAGAWYFNTTTDMIGGSEDLLDLYGVAPKDRQAQRATAEAFGRLIPNADQQAAFAMLIRAEAGQEHQAVWTVRRDDGELRAGHLSFRIIVETAEDGSQERVLRGITHDIGLAEATPAAPPPPILEQRVLESMSTPGEHRVLINLKSMRIIRWIDEPMPDLLWQLDLTATEHPWIHPDDEPAAQALSSNLSHGRTSGTLRLAAQGGGWIAVAIVANIVLLDQHTTAGLFTLSQAH